MGERNSFVIQDATSCGGGGRGKEGRNELRPHTLLPRYIHTPYDLDPEKGYPARKRDKLKLKLKVLKKWAKEKWKMKLNEKESKMEEAAQAKKQIELVQGLLRAGSGRTLSLCNPNNRIGFRVLTDVDDTVFPAGIYIAGTEMWAKGDHNVWDKKNGGKQYKNLQKVLDLLEGQPGMDFFCPAVLVSG